MPVSIIIPTLNEEHYVAGAIRSARAQRPHEILVVDGGSSDRTRAAAAGADRFLEAPRGRARQMNFAARQASGEALLFLNADCALEEGALLDAERLLRHPGVVAGCFRQTVQAPGWLYRCIDSCATARVRLAGLAYGDQGLFLRKTIFHEVRGFPEVGLLEDVLLCRRLHRLGRLAVASKRIFVSPRRWRQVGIIRQSLRNWALTALAATGVAPDRLANFYPMLR